jgi:hypothetical protein
MLLPLLLLAADLSTQTAPRLKVAWIFLTHAQAPNQRAATIAAFEATPVLAGKLLYGITPFDQVIAGIRRLRLGAWQRPEPWSTSGHWMPGSSP